MGYREGGGGGGGWNVGGGCRFLGGVGRRRVEVGEGGRVGELGDVVDLLVIFESCLR